MTPPTIEDRVPGTADPSTHELVPEDRQRLLDQAHATWRQAVKAYQSPDLRMSLWQLATSVVPYIALWYLAYRLLDISFWAALPALILAAGFLVRVFIVFHDCGHGSFFKSKKANDLIGYLTGILTFTPYHDWRLEHARHHATAGDLDRRGLGDVWTMTVAEYREAPPLHRLGYRLYRNPLVMFGLGPIYSFIIKQRLPRAQTGAKGRNSVHITNLALVIVFGALFLTIGVGRTLAVQLPILAIGGAAGIWLFYVQHQFEDVYWDHHDQRDYVKVGMEGSSYYNLPRILQWFSGNIGFHHIHHLSPAIPNYRLPACHRDQEIFEAVEPLTLRTSLRSLRLRLYDEEARRMVSFRGASA